MNDAHEVNAESGIFTMDVDDADDGNWRPPRETCRYWLRKI